MNAKEYLKKNLYPSDHPAHDSVAQLMEEYHQAKSKEEAEEMETKLLDAINAGLFKWEFKKKLNFDDAFDLLTCLQETILSASEKEER